KQGKGIDRLLTPYTKLSHGTGGLGIYGEKMTALVDLSLRLASVRDPLVVAEDFCAGARSIVGAKYASVGLISDDGNSLSLFLTSGVDPRVTDEAGWPSPHDGALGRILKERRVVKLLLSGGDACAAGFPPGYPPIHSFLGAPLVYQDRVYGWLCVANKLGAGNFSTEDERLAQVLAFQLAAGYENARLERDVLSHADEMAREVRLRRRAEETANEYARIVEASEDAIISITLDGKVRTWNLAAEQMFGYTAAEARGRSISFIVPSERSAELSAMLGAIKSGKRVSAHETFRVRRDGMRVRLAVSHSALRDADGNLCGVCSRATRNQADRNESEEALVRSGGRFKELAEISHEVFWVYDVVSGKMVYVSPAYEDIFGRTCDELYRTPRSYFESVHPEDTQRISMAHERQIRGQHTDEEYRVIRPDGRCRWVKDRAFPITDESGKTYRVAGIVSDVTVQKQLEEQLRGAQKMEAVGRLAGGVAHDFNNLLTAILGYSQLALARLNEGEPLHKFVDEIRKAGQRAAQLTSHLLAFTRKQVLQPRVIDLNTVIMDIEKMLNRLIGEDINFTTDLEPELRPVKADRGQIDQVIMNLVVNARDAMPRGGNLTIRTSNVDLDALYADLHMEVDPGAYVLLAVTDSGIGMDKETMAQVFDPFFTTKEPGKGTGLGLSTVYGIVNQSGGHIWVYSEPGIGTTFKIYLRAADEAIDRRHAPREADLPVGTETILLVEDEPMVRDLAAFVLGEQGYTVLEASEGDQALRLAEEHTGKIHLVLTDVIMPKLGGRELAERLELARPETRVLFYSGYSDTAIGIHGRLDHKANFLEKPFTRDSLARKVREVLDAPDKKQP
ncbi:MAG TPA: PAS domain S-box protein, partial [Blastocatellia bacterium]|nr:PAS domain S-box protein [Blastocatellia bacterium]